MLAFGLVGAMIGGGGFLAYAAGNKIYGAGRSMPTMGRVDPLGYRERDALAAAKRNAILRKMQAQLGNRYLSPQWLRGQRG